MTVVLLTKPQPKQAQRKIDTAKSLQNLELSLSVWISQLESFISVQNEEIHSPKHKRNLAGSCYGNFSNLAKKQIVITKRRVNMHIILL